MREKILSFTDLKTWQEGHKLVLLIYKVTDVFPKTEICSLVDQIRRCVISITSNVAEGFSRQGKKEKLQFYFTAKGSLTELQNQLLVARDFGYLVAHWGTPNPQANLDDRGVVDAADALIFLSNYGKESL